MKARTTTASILYVLFAVVFMGVHMITMPTILANFAIAAVGLCALAYCIICNGLGRSNSYLILFGISFTLFMVLSILYNGNADFLDILWIWAYMGAAALLYEFSIPRKVYWWVAYGIIICLFVHIASGGTPKGFLTFGSENNISVYLIFFVLVAYLSQMKEEAALQYLPAFLTVAICLWSGSRGGTLSAAVMVGGVFLYNFLSVKKGKLSSVLKMGALLALGVSLLDRFGGNFIKAFARKVERYGGESVRTEIWMEYIRGACGSVGNFLFGVNTTDGFYVLLHSVGGNIHNAFLTLHAKFGLFACVFLVILIFAVLSKSAKEKNGVIVVALATASVRMLFDWIAFPGLYDVLFWYMLLYVLDRRVRPRNEQ